LLRFYAAEYAAKAEPLLCAHLAEVMALDQDSAGDV